MTSIQRNIVEFLNDYRHMVTNQAHEYEEYGLASTSARLKEKIIEIESTLNVFRYSCEIEESKNLDLPFDPRFDRRKH